MMLMDQQFNRLANVSNSKMTYNEEKRISLTRWWCLLLIPGSGRTREKESGGWKEKQLKKHLGPGGIVGTGPGHSEWRYANEIKIFLWLDYPVACRPWHLLTLFGPRNRDLRNKIEVLIPLALLLFFYFLPSSLFPFLLLAFLLHHLCLPLRLSLYFFSHFLSLPLTFLAIYFYSLIDLSLFLTLSFP